MKKIILAALMLTGMLSAHADVAISEATYGIINIPIIAGMNAIGISLLPMPGVDNAVENIVLPEGLTATTQQGTADKLYVFNGDAGYNIYWLDENNGNPVWNKDGVSHVASPGDGMWINAQAPGTVYEIGLVAGAETIIPLKGGNNFIANPYPADLNLANVTWTGVAAANKNTMRKADLLRTWNAATEEYTTFFYVENDMDPTGWYHANTYQLAPEIPAGEGFWFFSRNATLDASITITKPNTL